jgi:hypothetical protein
VREIQGYLFSAARDRSTEASCQFWKTTGCSAKAFPGMTNVIRAIEFKVLYAVTWPTFLFRRSTALAVSLNGRPVFATKVMSCPQFHLDMELKYTHASVLCIMEHAS